MKLERKVQNIEISNVDGNHDALVKIFKKFGPCLHSVSLLDCKIDDFTLREILKSADSLDTLILTEVAVIKKLPAINPVGMRKLKTLTINHCDWNVIKFITAQIKTLELKSYLDEGSKCNLINFIAQQRKLIEMSLRGTSSRVLFQRADIVINCNFSLHKFHLDNFFGKNSDNVNGHITAFLGLQIKTLKNVEISGPHCDRINSFVVTNLENLESLAIDVHGLPKDDDFYEFADHEPNTKLKSFSLRGYIVRHDAIKKILNKYSMIEKLELFNWGNRSVVNDMLDFISASFPKLKQLTISEMSNGENIKFSSLTHLNVTFIRSTDKLVQFLSNNPSIEKLQVGLVTIGKISSNFVEELNGLKHVKHLVFGGKGPALAKILDLMKTGERPESWQSLELRLSADENLSSRKGKKFFFPIANSTKFEGV